MTAIAGVLQLERANRPGDQAAFVETLSTVLAFEAIGHLGKSTTQRMPRSQARPTSSTAHQAPTAGAGHRADRDRCWCLREQNSG